MKALLENDFAKKASANWTNSFKSLIFAQIQCKGPLTLSPYFPSLVACHHFA